MGPQRFHLSKMTGLDEELIKAVVSRRQDGIYHAIRTSCYRSLQVHVTECNSGYSSTSAAETNLVKLVLCGAETRGSFWNSLKTVKNIFIDESATTKTFFF